MVGNYLILAISISTIPICLFKIKKEISFRLLGITACVNGILISIARIFAIKHILNYPIAVVGILTFIIMTYIAWKIRKIPGKKFAAYFWLIGMPCLGAYALIMYLLIEAGVFGH